MFKYYLDTSSLYNIRKFPKSIAEECFFSSFGLLELVAGLDEETFQRRKIALSSAINSGAKCDPTFPEQLILKAFDAFEDCEFLEQRADDLLEIVDDIIGCNSFDDFQNKILQNDRKFDWQYFIQRDRFYSENFARASKKGADEIRAILNDPSSSKVISLFDKTYDLSSRRAIIKFLKEPHINDSITISSLATEALRISQQFSITLSEQEVVKTYNGQAKIYVDAMSNYSTDQIINDRPAGRNDLQDLIHLLYLRNSPEWKIISDDKIFVKCVPDKSLSLSDLLA